TLAFLGIMNFVLLSSQPLLGQEKIGSIEGIVKDSSGAVLPGATITATNKTTGRTTKTTSTDSGLYVMQSLEPGRYSIMAELKGFSIYQLPDALLLLGRTLNVDITLNIGTIEQTVEV